MPPEHDQPQPPGPAASPGLRRSCLVVPGHATRMHAKALASAADEVVFDLEDAVAPEAKEQARREVLQTLEALDGARRRVAVRINGADTEWFTGDLACCSRLAREDFSVVVPKVQDAATVARVRAALGRDVPVQALIETPAGLLGAREIAAAEGVAALILGYADLAAALGRRGAEEDLARWAVAQELLLAAARAAGVEAIDGPFFGLGDIAGLRDAISSVKELGYDGKWAIHPEQIDPINDGFAASPQEHRWAAQVIDAVAHAAADGSAVARLGGAMVDEAMVRRARRLAALPARRRAPAARDAEEQPPVLGPPYFDDLRVGQVFGAPGLTLTAGHAALHQAVVGDRLRLALDAPLFAAVTGAPGLLAHPQLVCDAAIGQSTEPSGRVLGNLFYRGLACRPVAVGTTLRTRTEVVALRSASRGRGVAALRVTTTDADGQAVLDFWRCPLLPSRASGGAEHADDLDALGQDVNARALVPAGWTLEPLRAAPLGALFGDLVLGAHRVEAGDTVTGAPELARLTLNVAMTHTDPAGGAHGRRLVYGGHVIGIAAAHVTRVLPDLATILAWHSCDHLGPTFEGDVLRTVVELTALEALDDGGLVHFRARTSAQGADGTDPREVLDWRAVGLMP
jgi:citrate lyase beta subunit/acyl dehydratase